MTRHPSRRRGRSLLGLAAVAGAALLALTAGTREAQASHFRGAACTWKVDTAGNLTIDCYHLWRCCPYVGFSLYRGPSDSGYLRSVSSYTVAEPVRYGTEYAGASYEIDHWRWTNNIASLASSMTAPPSQYNPPAGAKIVYARFESCCRVSTLRNGHDSSFAIELGIIYRPGIATASPTMLPATIDIIAKTYPYTQNLNAVDPAGKPVSYSFRGGTGRGGASFPDYGPTVDIPGIQLTSSGTVFIPGGTATGTTGSSALTVGQWAYKVRVTNSMGGYTERDVLVVVNNAPTNINLAPVMPTIGDKSVNVNATLSFPVTASDPNSGQRLYIRAKALPQSPSCIASGRCATFNNSTTPYTQVYSGISYTTAWSAASVATTNGGAGLTGNFNWTPTNGDEGDYYVTFETFDGYAQSNLADPNVGNSSFVPITASQTIRIRVTGANNPPRIVNPGNKTVANGATLTFDLSGSDPDGNAISFSGFNLPSGASLTSAGHFTWTPNSSQYNSTFTGITFRVTDNGVPNLTADATITIAVGAGNAAPVIDPLSSYTVAPGQTVSFTVRATDPNSGQVITLSASALPAGATFSGATATAPAAASSTFSWVPSTPGSYSATFVALDNGVPQQNTEATVSIAVDTPPTAVADTYAGNQDTVLAVAAPGVLTNDTGADVGQILSAQLVTNPTKGVLTLNSNGSFAYTPNPGTYGNDSFTYRTSDGLSLSAPGTVTLVINGRPTANSQTVTTLEDTAVGITLTSSDPENNPRTYTILTSPTKGTLSGTAPNLTYTPSLNLNGADSFTFRVSDGQLSSNTATVTINITPVNDAPTTSGQNVTTAEDTPLSITLTYNDVDGDPVTFSIVTAPAHGTLTTGTGPTRTYTPAQDYNGTDSFVFRVTDPSGAFAQATVNITITPVNDAPVSQNSSVTTAEDTAVSFTLQAYDVDSPTLTYAIVTQPAHGTLGGAGSARTYTPALNYNGTDSFTFTTNDGLLTSNVATVTITITPVNDAPVASNQSVTLAEDTPTAITLTAIDVENDPLTYAIVAAPTHGTLSAISGRVVTYTPVLNYNGADSFTFRANDGLLNSNTATVTLNVTPVNDPPVANSQSVTTAEDTPLSITLTGSDVDSPASSLTYAIATAPAHGTLMGTAPNLTYTPALNYNGTDSFTFTMSDGALTSAAATVSITITAVNDPPVANNQTVVTNEDTSVAITLTGFDVDSPTLTYSIVAQPLHGTLTGTPPNLVYLGAANYFGADSFTFRISDGLLFSNTATVSITVNPVNDPPVANSQSVTTLEDTPLGITLTGSDVDSPVLTYTVLTQPTKGVLTGTPPTLTYSPSLNLNGTDSFTFRISDGSLTSNIATVSITITPVNDPPVANPLAVTTNEDTAVGITLTGSDVDSSTLTFSVVAAPAHGTLSGTPPNLSYLPALNYNGTDAFTFKLNDGQADSNIATVSITIVAVNDPPIAQSQAIVTDEDTPKSVVLVATDVDSMTLTYSIVAAPAHGTLSGTAPNLTYTPAANYNGTDSFTFRASDGQALSNVAAVSITINPVNDPPVPAAQNLTTSEDTALPITLTATDVDNDPLTYSITISPTNGALTGSAPNVTYTPNLNYNGRDQFTFRVFDGTVGVTAVVSITVLAVNDPPVANGQSLTLAEDTPTPITLTGSDVDSTTLTYSIVDQPAHGAISGSPPNVTYTPAQDYNGSDSFTFRIYDGQLYSNTAVVRLTITPVNDPPVPTPQTVTTLEDTPVSITLSGTDVDGDPLTYSIATTPTKGTLSGTPPNLLFTPSRDLNGPDAFTFRVSDGQVSVIGTITINITPVNDPPVANSQSVTLAEDTPTAITLVATDVDSPSLTYSIVTQPTNGTLSGTPPNLMYTPRLNFNGSDSFSFRAYDGALFSNSATVSLTVTPVNDAPVADPQTLVTLQSQSVSIVLTGSDVDGDPITFSIFSPPTKGVLSGTPPNVSYRPNSGVNGTDSFTFRAFDGQLYSAPATISISIVALNSAPTAQPASVTTPEDTPVNIVLTATDPENDPLTYQIAAPPLHGTLTGTPPNVSYTPNLNYNGIDSFTFTAKDALLTSPAATVRINITPVNDAPVALALTVTTLENASVPITLMGTDVDGDALTFAVATQPTKGALSGTPPNLTYTPNPYASGSDSFRYTAFDGQLTSTPATVSITITKVNSPPVAQSQTVTTLEDTATSISLSASDPDNDPLTYSIAQPPSFGTLSGTAPILTYTPNLNFNGTDVFTFRVSDGLLSSSPAVVTINVTPVNDPPVATPRTVTTLEDTAVGIALSGTDPDGDALTFTVTTQPAKGVLTGVPPNLIYTPNANVNGTDSFTFRASDGIAQSPTATITITIVAVNDPPVAIGQTVNTDEDTPKTITLTGTDPENDPLTFTIVTPPSRGTLSGTPPTVAYTPNLNYNGTDVFTFRVSDGQLQSAPTSVTINIAPVNDPPVANPLTVTTIADTPVNITLTGTDVENDPLSFAIVARPAHGSLTGTPPNVTYTPNTYYSGTDTFTFRVSDGQLTSPNATVTISVTPVNHVPTATPQSVTTLEDTAVNITLAGTDPDGDPLTFQIVAQPQSGTLTGTAPNLTYLGNANYNGVDSFRFVVKDAVSTSPPATVTITITPVNDPPIANAQSLTTAQGTPVAVTLTGTDVDGDALTFTILTQPAHGTLTGTSPFFTYVPAASYRGADGFTFRASDGVATSPTATISINVTAVNQAPTASAQSVTLAEDTPRTIVLTGTDPENDTLAFFVETQPQHGTLTGTAPNLTYSPAPNYNGPDAFAFSVSDGQLRSAPATVTLTVTPVNDPPVAQARSITTSEDTPVAVALAGTDVDGDPLTFRVVNQPSKGTLSGTPPNLLYTPGANLNGTDTFTYVAFDGIATSDPATVTITITPVNDAPVASGQSLTTPEDTPRAITLAATDVDGDTLTYTIVAQPTHGTLTGTGRNLTYTPALNFNGNDAFTFYAFDGQLPSETVTVSILVTPVNDPPVAATQSVTTLEDTPISIRLSATDVDGDPLTYAIAASPTRGTLAGTPPNVVYTPAPNYNGTDSFTFTAFDGQALSAAATVSIAIAPVNDPPVATPRSVTTPEDTPLNIALTGTDVDGDPLTFRIETPPEHGTLTGAPPNVRYAPAPNYFGADSFTFRVSDGQLTSDPAVVSITVLSVNDAPVADSQSVITAEDTPVAITLSATDIENDPLTFSIATPPTLGTLSGTPPALTYTPLANANGNDSFTFVANDGQALSAPATVSITITPVNDPPVALAQTVTTAEDTPIAITLTATDPENDALVYSIEAPPQNGILSGQPPNVTYTPNPNYNGTDFFSFYVFDGQLTSSMVPVTIIVTPVNDPPVATSGGVTTAEDTPIGITLEAVDVDGDPLTFLIDTPPQHGSLAGTPPNVVYTPAANYNGTDSFTFRADDGQARSAPGVMTITITPVNDAPVATSQSVSTLEDTALSIQLAAVDVDNEPLTFTLITQPEHGTLTGTPPNVTYMPQPNYNGTDSFSFLASDALVTSPPGTVSITVIPVNDPPIAIPINVATLQDVPATITLVGDDVDLDPLTFAVVAQPTHGRLSGTQPNLTYTPNAGYVGTDSFTFTANDGTVTSPAATVSILVKANNHAPTANAQSATLAEDTTLALTLTGSDPDADPLNFRIFNPPAFGTLTGTPPNVTYRPVANFNGTDTFKFVVSDGSLSSSPATVTLTITPVNDAPVALPSAFTTPEDTPVAVRLQATDVDGDTLTWTILSQPQNGVLSGTAPNLVYTPNQFFNGADYFSFKVNDGTVDSNRVTVSIVTTPVNNPPVAQSATVETLEDTPLSINLYGFDPDADPIRFELVTLPSHGVLAGTPPNVVYTPSQDYNGNDEFTYRVRDALSQSPTATITIIVNGVNDRPVALDDTLTTPGDTPLSLLLDATDVDGDDLTYRIETQPQYGTLYGEPPLLTYQPLTNFRGQDTFTFTAFDGALRSLPGTIVIVVQARNHAPVALPVTATVAEEGSVQIRLQATDADRDPLTYQIVTAPSHGTVDVVGQIATYAPAPLFNGTDTFTFRVSDGQATSAPATVTITVTPVNHTPTATPMSVTTAEDVSLPIRLAGTDPDQDPLSFTVLTQPSHGSLFGTPPNVTYVPNADYNGTDAFNFLVSDGQASSAPATVTIHVTPVNDRPVANPRRVVVQEDAPTPITLTGSDVDGDVLTYVVTTDPAHGTLTGDAPYLTYIPDLSFSGSDSFAFTVDDGQLTSVPATISIVLSPVNDPPQAQDQTVATAEGVPLGITLQAIDLDGDPMTFRIATPPSHGRLTGSPPNVIYVPDATFHGTDSFTFTASDAVSTSLPATVTIRVTYENNPPVPEAQNIVTAEDIPVTITLRATDIDGDRLTFALVAQPEHGTLSGTIPNLVYTPAQDYYGRDVFTFSVSDGIATSAPARVNIQITPVNDPPVAASQTLTTPEDTALQVTLSATDVEGDALRFEIVTSPPNGALIGSPPGLTYVPTSNYFGMDSFTFRAFDGVAYSNTATILINVTPVNDPPVARSAQLQTAEDTPLPIVLQATDADNDPLTFTIVSPPAHGHISGQMPSIIYAPAPDFFGVDSFTFTAFDGQATSNAATVTVTVTPVNDPPLARPQTVITAEDTPVLIVLDGTDVDNDPLTFTVNRSPAHGTLTGVPPRLTYTPNQDFNGTDNFSFNAYDGQSYSRAAEISIVVTPVNDPPVAQTQLVQTLEDTPFDITLSAFDVDGDNLTFSIASPPSHGTVSISGSVAHYAPDVNFNGIDTFTFVANDGQASSGPATVRITIVPVNDPPVAVDKTVATQSGQPVTITLLGTDVDGDALRFAIVAPPVHGSLGGAPPIVTYLPSPGFVGTDSFTFTAFDGIALSQPGTVTVNVRLVNRAPMAMDQVVDALEDTPILINLTATDPDNDPLTYTVLSQPAHGTLSGTDSQVTYTPEHNFNGTDEFTFTASDGSLTSEPATVHILVASVNDPPTALAQSVTTTVGRAVAILLGGTDPEGDTLSYQVVTSPTHGTLTGTAPNLVFTPTRGYIGADAFTFTVSDGQAISDAATVSIDITDGPANQAPTATAGAYRTDEDTPLNVNLTGLDPEGQPLTFAIATPPAHGALSGTPPRVVYTPAPDFNGVDSFTFTANDGDLTSDPATVTITVAPVNDAPKANAQSVTTPQDTSVSITLTATDVDSASVSYSVIDLPLHGSLSGSPPNITYAPLAGFHGEDRFSFTASDGALTSVAAVVSITVTPASAVNHAPVATPQSVDVAGGQTVSITVTGFDPDGDPLTFALVAPPQNGVVGGTAPSFTYTPSPGFSGIDTFTFSVSDGQATSAPATITLNVSPGDTGGGCGCTTTDARGPVSGLGALVLLAALFSLRLRRRRIG